MSANNLNMFLKALENVRQDLLCAVCSELCDNPVTLSKCFHLICSAHFEGLKSCPTCGTSLEVCTTFVDKDLAATIEANRVLNEMFQPYKENLTADATAKGRRPLRKQDKDKVTLSTDSVKTKPAAKISKVPEEKSVKKVPSKNSMEVKQSSKTPEEKSAKRVPSSMELNQSRASNMSSTNLNKGLEKCNKKGETILHIACRLGKLDKVVELLEQGANTNTKDHAGWTPLHEAVQTDHLELVKLLLQHNTLINVPGSLNETPLHEAVRYQRQAIAEVLVKNGADVYARNCKGETPLDVASKEMNAVLEAAAENVFQTQTVNVDKISNMHSQLDFDDIHVYCTSEYRTAQNKLKALTKHHSNLHIETKFTKKVTHLIVDTDDLISNATLDILQGILNEIWILDSKWITNSTEDKLEPFEKYEVIGIGNMYYNGPKNARYNKYKQLPRLFDGCHFYLHNFNTKYEISKSLVLNKTLLSKLINDGGGVVLRRVPNPESIPESEKLVPYHAARGGALADCSHYIIFKDLYEPQYNMKHLKALPVGWLVECIEKYQLCDP